MGTHHDFTPFLINFHLLPRLLFRSIWAITLGPRTNLVIEGDLSKILKEPRNLSVVVGGIRGLKFLRQKLQLGFNNLELAGSDLVSSTIEGVTPYRITSAR